MFDTYPAWWYKTITLYNKVTEDGKIAYFRHVLHGCSVSKSVSVVVDGGNAGSVATTTVRIRQSADYLPPRSYADSGTAAQTAYFTLTPGDIVFDGEIADDMADEQGKRPSDILKKHSGFIIKTCVDNTSASPKHYRCGD